MDGRWNRAIRRIAITVAVLAFGLVSASAPALAAGSPSPTPTITGRSSTPASGGSAGKPAGVTFGAGPASATKLDGRPSFSYQDSPGATSQDHIAIQNVGTKPLSLVIYPTDASNTAEGGIGYLDRGQVTKDVGSWITLNAQNSPQTVTVPAQKGNQPGTLIIPFTLSVPAKASPGDHTGGIAVGELAAVSGPTSKNATFEQRVVTRVYVRVSGQVTAALSVTKLKADYHGTLNPAGSGSVTLSYVVQNTGNVNLSGAQKVTISGMFGAKHAAVADVPLLLPGGSYPVSVRVSGVFPQLIVHGKVRVTPVAPADAVDPILVANSASTSVWAIPWGIVGLLVIVIALIVAWILFRRRATHEASHSKPAKGRSKSKSKARSKSKPEKGQSGPGRLGEATS